LPKKSNTYKIVNRAFGKALHRYDMISDGDRILVGLSGGKDSLTLMWLLNERRVRIPIHYEIHPVYIDPGFDDGIGWMLADYCRQNDIRLRVEKTDYGIVAHSSANRENPCFLCSWLRRKRLFEIADELGCNKLALGHNKDDIIETLFINMCYSGEISTMVPVQPFFKGRFIVIRPLAFVEENMTRRFSEERGFPNFENPCPSANRSKRSDIKALLSTLYQSNNKIKGNIFRSLSHVKLDYLL
jgi:tRNA 2-thiocytidine biosynthesis protein TtcA